jgi:hypothetical protein
MKSSRRIAGFLILTSAFSIVLLMGAQQSTEVTGVWYASDVTYAPWIFDLKQDGTTLTGTVRQSGAVTNAAPIMNGTVRGNELSFRLERVASGGAITFTGMRNGETIVFTRVSEVTTGVGDGLFGPAGPKRATATRQPGSAPAAPAARAPQVTTTNPQPADADSLRYVATTGVAFAPWTFTLKVENGTVTGSATQGNFDPASGFSTSLIGPFDVFDGKADGNQIVFKLRMPDGSRIATFNGTRNTETITFTRSIEILRGDPGRDGIMGINGAKQFSATLNASAAPAAISAPRLAVTANTSAVTPSPRTGAAGRWQVTGVPNAPWIFEFRVNGTSLTGTIQQSGVAGNPVGIAGGKVEDTTISFKVLSPDAERTVTFRGRVVADQISFTREIIVLDGGGRGSDDLFGGSGPLEFVANRVAGGNVLNHRGMSIDIAGIEAAPNRGAILESLRHQIEIVDEAAMKPEQKAFLKGIPVSVSSSFTGVDNGNYGRGRGVMLSAAVFDRDKPVLLHELLHGYHDQRLVDGFRNAEILKLYEQAREGRQFPAGAYMLSSPGEYFAMMASVFLHGSAARDPFLRAVIEEKQPDCYKWLQEEFGAR